MNKLNQLEQQMAVEEMGWRQVNGLWTNLPRSNKRYAALSSVLLFEWREALARAGRADHEVARQKNFVNILGLTVAALLAAIAVAAVMLWPR